MKQLPYLEDQLITVRAVNAMTDVRDPFALHEERLKRMKKHLTNSWLAGEKYAERPAFNTGFILGSLVGLIVGATNMLWWMR